MKGEQYLGYIDCYVIPVDPVVITCIILICKEKNCFDWIATDTGALNRRQC
jgi:hypothetical protein